MAEKVSVEQKEQIIIESFTVANITELCRRHGISVKQFYRWKDKFQAGGRKGLAESSTGNEYRKEIDDCNRSFKFTHFRPLKSTQKRPLNIYHPMHFHAGDGKCVYSGGLAYV